MIRKILSLLKRIVFAGFSLYAYNVIMAPLNLLIPINIITLSITTVFGIMAIPFLVLILIIIF